MLNLDRLRALHAVSARGSIIAAAETLNVTTSAVSQQLAKLEQETGQTLLERHGRGVRLTDAGVQLLASAHRILAEVQAATEEMGAFAGGLRGRVVVGTNQSLAETTLPGLLSRFHRESPGIEIALREGLAKAMVEGLSSGEFDVVLGDVGRASEHLDRSMRLTALRQEEVGLAVAPGHRLARRTAVPFSELHDEPFVIFPHGSVMTDLLLTRARMAGFEPRVAFESTDNLAVRALVAEGLGVTLLPRSLLSVPGPRLGWLSFAPDPLTRTVSLVHRRGGLGPSLRRFVAFLLEHYPSRESA